MTDLGQFSHSFFPPPAPIVKQFDQLIEGHIIVSEHLFPAPPTTPKLTRVSEHFFALERIALSGLEFRLYDGRSLYDGADRVSFVFCVDDDPQLDGTLVYVEEQGECRKYKDEQIQRADYFLAIPSIHLRYYLEDWVDELMGWVKYHFVENLRYWRYEDKWVNQAALTAHFGQWGRYEYYEMLKARLESEVAAWVGTARLASHFWQSVRGARADIDEN